VSEKLAIGVTAINYMKKASLKCAKTQYFHNINKYMPGLTLNDATNSLIYAFSAI